MYSLHLYNHPSLKHKRKIWYLISHLISSSPIISITSKNKTPLGQTYHLDRRRTSKTGSHGSTRPKHSNQTLDRSPGAHTRADETPEEVDDVHGVDVPVDHVPSDPTLDAGIVSRGDTGVGIETLAWERGVDLASVADVQDGGEGVGEVQDQEGADETGDAVQVGDGGGDDEGDDPVDGAEGVPEELALLGGDLGPVEDFLADFDVDGLHSDVEVEQASNERGDQTEHIVDLLQSERLDGISDVGDGVLAVVSIDESAEEDVHDADERLCGQHSLPEIPRVAHLSEESNEEEGTAIGVDERVDAVELAGETICLLHVGVRGWAGEGSDWLDDFDEGGSEDGLVVDAVVGAGDHARKC